MSLKVLLCCFALFVFSIHAHSNSALEIAFPEVWNGDSFRNESCPSKGVPTWLNGYFLVQTCASYGKLSNPVGQKITHMFDALGAAASLKIHDGKVDFSAKYYPTRGYKIWDFYDRDMSKSTVAWKTFKTPYNLTSVEMWDHIKSDNSFPVSPNVDFWKIGNTVVGATEYSGVGMQFDVPSLTNFAVFSFKETDDIFKYKGPIYPLAMPVHERVETDGSIYAAVAAFDPIKHKMFQIVFRVATDGTRTVEGIFDHGTYDPSKCAKDGSYTGDKKVLASYMHSITSTEHYVVLPLTSIILNPCKLPPISNKLNLRVDLSEHVKEEPSVMEFTHDVPVRFLIFDKIKKRFITEQLIPTEVVSFIVHQFNAYEDDDGTIIADMTGTATEKGSDRNGYDVLTVENMIKNVEVAFSRHALLRFQINPKTKTFKVSNILEDKDIVSMEFPAYNRDYMEKKYRFGYIIEFPYQMGSKIVKIDLNARKVVAEFSPPDSRAKDSVFKEPWFVPKHGSKNEDDGVVLALAGDVSTKTTTLYVLDGKSLKLIGQSEIPTFIPFGFHNRFYSLSDLGLDSDTNNAEQYCESENAC